MRLRQVKRRHYATTDLFFQGGKAGTGHFDNFVVAKLQQEIIDHFGCTGQLNNEYLVVLMIEHLDPILAKKLFHSSTIRLKFNDRNLAPKTLFDIQFFG